jgi:Protein of unknown function (DUF1203)
MRNKRMVSAPRETYRRLIAIRRTTMTFRISGLPADAFDYWFTLDHAELAQAGAARRVADSNPGFPCRISLTDAAVGEEVLLINYEHLPVDSPYRSRHAIYIRRGEKQCVVINEVPPMLRTRMLSVRAFDDTGLMVGADTVDGHHLESIIEKRFADSRAQFLHVHFAAPGCYAARVDRD